MPNIRKLKFTVTLFSIFFFFITTPLIISISLFTLIALDKNNNETNVIVQNSAYTKIFAALPDTSPTTSIKLISSDARGDIVKNYLEKYDSPLIPYAYYIVNVSDENNIDFRLLTAIARQESNLCKYIPENTYNCWGWGIHSQGTLAFASYEEGIKTVTKGLKNDYYDKGFNTPEDIMKKYTPLSNGSWAEAVNQFMYEME